jgi:hypothetical protein
MTVPLSAGMGGSSSTDLRPACATSPVAFCHLLGQGHHLRLEGRVGPVVARDRQTLRLDQHARWCGCAGTGGRRAPPFSFRVDLPFPAALHFQAVQPRQQDRSGQAGGEEGDRATRDDSNNGVAPGQFCEESGNPRHWLGELSVVSDGRKGPSKSLRIPAVAGSRRSGASGSPVSRATA